MKILFKNRSVFFLFVALFSLSAIFLLNNFNKVLAETPGNLKNVYCRMTRGELNASMWRVCNGYDNTEAGYLGWEAISDNHSTTTENTIKIGNPVYLQNIAPQNSNKNHNNQDTKCSVVQHDGLNNTNYPGFPSNQYADVWVQYSADASNYCIIHHNPNQQNLNHCVFNGGAKQFGDADIPGSSLNTQLKAKFDQICVAPSPTPVPPTGSLSTVCTPPNQNYISNFDNNLSYNLNVTDLPANSNAQVQYQLCINPQTDQGHRSVYHYYFNSGANWEGPKNSEGLPSWACYKIGENVTTNNTYHSRTWNETISLYGNTSSEPKNIETMAKFVRDAAEVGNMNINTEFRTKVVVTVNGIKNDQIVAPQLRKIHPTACYVAPTATPTSTPTSTPTPPACNWTHTVLTSDWMGGVINHTSKSNTVTLTGLDYSRQIKVGVDWGWTGKIDGNNPQKGPVDIEGIIHDLDADTHHQTNETSKVEFNPVKKDGTLDFANKKEVNCLDVGEFKPANSNLTRFSDGRKVYYYPNPSNDLNPILSSNLQEVMNGGGEWYTCPVDNVSGGGWPQLSLKNVNLTPNSPSRPNWTWKYLQLNSNTHDNKLKIDKLFTGGPITSNNKLKGSHYTRVIVSWCQTSN